MNLRRLTGPAAAAAVLLCAGTPFARADAVAYLVNVTVRPGYDFPNADTALAYGNGMCDKVRAGERYAQIMREVKDDFSNPDDYQASYLISQAVGELCPAQIWQLRQSAAGYVPPLGRNAMTTRGHESHSPRARLAPGRQTSRIRLRGLHACCTVPHKWPQVRNIRVATTVIFSGRGRDLA